MALRLSTLGNVWITFLVSVSAFVFSFFFFFFFLTMFSCGMLSVSGSYALCTGPTTFLTNKFCTEMCLSVGPMQCTGPTTFLTCKFCTEMCLLVGPMHGTHKSLFSHKFLLKISLMVLFTHLKIILLRYFQQNKRYPNEPLRLVKANC